MKKNTAKVLRTSILIVWTIAAIALIFAIRSVGDNVDLKNTVTFAVKAFAVVSVGVYGIVFHLTKIIKKGKDG